MLRRCVAWLGRAGSGNACLGESWQTHGAFNESVGVWFFGPMRRGWPRRGQAGRGGAVRCLAWQTHGAFNKGVEVWCGTAWHVVATPGQASPGSTGQVLDRQGNHTPARKGAGKF